MMFVNDQQQSFKANNGEYRQLRTYIWCQIQKMSPKVFYLSFSSILLVTTLRVGYSSAKPHLKKQYNLESSFLALMDCLIVFGIAIGFMLRFHFLGSGNPIKTLRLNGLMMCFFYLCLPVIPLINSQNSFNVQSMLLGSSFIFGFLFSFFWPSLRSEFLKFYSRQSDECLFSCWQSARNMGKVLGFVFMTMTSEWSWQVSLIVLTVLMIIDINVLHYYLVTKQIETLREEGFSDVESHGVIPAQMTITLAQFWEFAKDSFMKPEIRFFVVLCSFYKAMHENFIYWLPTYLFSHNFEELAGQITLAFVIPIVTGSFIIGKLYEHSSDQEQTFFNSTVFLATTGLISVGGLLLLSTMDMNYIQFIMVIFVEGAVIGGFFNIIDEQRKIIAVFNRKETQMMWTLCRSFNSLTTGIVTWVIGVVMGIREINQDPHVQESIFNVLLVVSVLGLIFLGLWIFSMHKKHEREEQEYQSDSLDV